MSFNEGLVKEQMRFLSMEPDKLQAVKGRELYETLSTLGLNHSHFFRALGISMEDYCAREFGVDLRHITTERFFTTDPNAKWLFPDIVREAVLTGLRRKPFYPSLISRDESVTGTAVDLPYVTESETEESVRPIAEGAAIPESELTYGDRVVRLTKLGRGVTASYEVIRRMSVDMLRIHLQRIGERLGRLLDSRLADVLVNGDNSGSTAPITVNTATVNTWTYADLLNGFLKLSTEHFFTPTHLIVNPALCKTILNLSEFKNGDLFDFAKTGSLPTPLGLKIIPIEDQPENKLTILDAGYAAVKLTEQDLLIESDKLINQQWDRSYLTVVTDFAVLYDKARVVVQSDWT